MRLSPVQCPSLGKFSITIQDASLTIEINVTFQGSYFERDVLYLNIANKGILMLITKHMYEKYCTKFSITDMGILLLDLNSCIKVS